MTPSAIVENFLCWIWPLSNNTTHKRCIPKKKNIYIYMTIIYSLQDPYSPIPIVSVCYTMTPSAIVENIKLSLLGLALK